MVLAEAIAIGTTYFVSSGVTRCSESPPKILRQSECSSPSSPVNSQAWWNASFAVEPDPVQGGRPARAENIDRKRQALGNLTA